jgi:hypothetical protein
MQRLILMSTAVLGIVVGIAACTDNPVQPGTIASDVSVERSFLLSQPATAECTGMWAPHLKEAAHLLCSTPGLNGDPCILVLQHGTTFTAIQSSTGPVEVTFTRLIGVPGLVVKVETPQREFESTISEEEFHRLCPEAA